MLSSGTLITQLLKKRRRSKDLTGEESFPDTRVTLQNLKAAWQLSQFCLTIEDIQKHFGSICKKTNQYTCKVCRKKTYWSCGLCNTFICLLNKHHWNGGRCAFLYHNDKYFGLARSDYIHVIGKGWENGQRKTKDKIKKELAQWKPANEAAIERNACSWPSFVLMFENTATTSKSG
jgi:hypothetical protein